MFNVVMREIFIPKCHRKDRVEGTRSGLVVCAQGVVVRKDVVVEHIARKFEHGRVKAQGLWAASSIVMSSV